MAAARPYPARYREGLPALLFQCPACRSAQTNLAAVEAQPWTCTDCGTLWACEQGIVRGLTPDARRRYARFFEDYLAIRHAEGRGSDDPAYYLELPFRSGHGPVDWQWSMRAATYRYFERKILAPLARAANRPLSILDLGAGVGWLSYRLALRGHQPVAVDLLDDSLDGLGAARHYPRPFPRIQAEMDNVPLSDEQFDLAIFNASFHYATDYRATLREARRLLGWGGQVIILDTPIYRSFQHGEQMRAERQVQFERTYGFRSDSVLSMEYLDEQMILDLGKDLNIRWRAYRPWYGLRWHLRPLQARLKGRRPPSRFEILVGSWTGA